MTLPIVLLGSPRSGTTWIGKVFDSHPAVLYRHEPDRIDKGQGIPQVLDLAESTAALPAGRDWFGRLLRMRHFEVNAIPPFFPKQWTGRADRSRRAWQSGARWVGEASNRAGLRLPLEVPDTIDLDRTVDVVPVLKSVSGLGRARLFHDASDGWLVLMLRHPCGYVASIRRGMTERRMRGAFYAEALSTTVPARGRGLTVETLFQLGETARYATNWGLWNDHALAVLDGAARVVVVSYDALTRDPQEGTRRLFAAVGLSWSTQTEAFLDSLSRLPSTARYFSIARNPAGQSERWRRDLTDDEIASIEREVEQTEAYRLHQHLADADVLPLADARLALQCAPARVTLSIPSAGLPPAHMIEQATTAADNATVRPSAVGGARYA